MATTNGGEAAKSPRFGKANFTPGTPKPRICAVCRKTLDDYYTVNGQSACPGCTRLLHEKFAGPLSFATVVRATIFGLGGAVVGSFIYWIVRRISGYEIGYIAILVGWIVGECVRRAANSRGGLMLQLIAVALTYLSIVSSYVPDLIEQHSFSVIVLPFLLIAPFLAAKDSPIILVIVGFALFYAWRRNRTVKLQVSGPHKMPPIVVDTTAAVAGAAPASPGAPNVPARSQKAASTDLGDAGGDILTEADQLGGPPASP